MAELLLYGVIGDPADALDSATVTTLIRAASGPLSVRINSPGGYVMEGLAIVAALRAYGGPVAIYIDGLAASMASVIAMVGDTCVMAESAMLMVHKPWDASIGNANDMRNDAAQLDRIEQQMIGIYAQRTKLPEGEIAAMLTAETWFDAAEALAAGFVTAIAAPLRLAAMAKATGYGFRHLPDQLKEQSVPEITDTAQAAVAIERTRIATIMALATKHKIPGAVSQALIERGTSLDDARASLLDYLATEGDRAGIGHAFGQHTTLDNPATRGKAMADAIAAKLLNKPATGPAAEYRGASLIDIARECLAASGVRDAHRMSPDRVAAMVMRPDRPRIAGGARADITQTTSDFPDIMQTSINTSLAAQYLTLQSPLKALTQVREVPNFKDQTIVRVSSFGTLDHVGEGGEYKNKSISTSADKFRVDTYGNMINFSRQMLINDSLGALADITTHFARAVANQEADMIAAAINGNPVMADGHPWFSSNHNNLGVDGGPPTIAYIDIGRQAMRSQKDLDGESYIDATPKFLVVPLGLQTAAETLVANMVAPGTLADVNPFFHKLEPISDPRLSDQHAWFLFADPAFAPAFISAYLDGNPGPFIDQELGWRVDGIEYKVRHDFGVGIVDSKMAYKNPGFEEPVTP